MVIIDNLEKFNQKKKLWMTPKHPLYQKSKEFLEMYSALIFMQGELNDKVNPLDNFELKRLLTAGFELENGDIAKVFRISKNKGEVIDYLIQNMKTKEENYFLFLDLVNISLQYREEMNDNQKESLAIFRKMFDVTTVELSLIENFVREAKDEQVTKCREILHRMHIHDMELTSVDMKYYVMQLWDTIPCTQDMVNTEREVRIVDRCVIREDLILYPGTKLIFDHARVRIYGNIQLLGGELYIYSSKIIRKGDSHRACVNMRDVHSKIVVKKSEIDCRNLGMFIRAEAGELFVDDSSIYQTTRGAAIRFWGNEIKIEESVFYDCYSPEDGGAIMIRTPNAIVNKCTFKRCEARRGGAIFAVEGNVISDCHFLECIVAEYGAAVFYNGIVRANVRRLVYDNCFPKGVETVQYLAKLATVQITGEYHIKTSTIIDCPVLVEAEGNLIIEDANIYLKFPICCRGSIQMKNVKLISNHLEKDMLILEHSRYCRIHHCEFNGMAESGGIYAAGSRIVVTKSLFRNIATGRAIYDAYAPEIRECIFNFCQNGAIYSQNGDIKRCVFVNCRGKSGAGVLMYGNRGGIEQCNFKRCISDYSGGAIDRSLGQQVIKCIYEDCKPDNVS